MHAPVQAFEQQFDHFEAHAGTAKRQTLGAKQEHGANGFPRERFANPHRVRQNQVALQQSCVFNGDANVGEFSETSGDAVDRFVVRDELFDVGSGLEHVGAGFNGQCHRMVFSSDAHHVGDSEWLTNQDRIQAWIHGCHL